MSQGVHQCPAMHAAPGLTLFYLVKRLLYISILISTAGDTLTLKVTATNKSRPLKMSLDCMYTMTCWFTWDLYICSLPRQILTLMHFPELDVIALAAYLKTYTLVLWWSHTSKEKLLVQNPCTLESSYTLGCMTIHPSCIEKHSACSRENTPHCLVLWHHSTSQLYYDFLRCVGCTLRVV